MLASPTSHDPLLQEPHKGRPSPACFQTSFVGRGAELRRLRSVADPARVVSIVGPAGSGKSRLALELARSFAHPLEVSLRRARTETALLEALSSSLGIRLRDGRARAHGLGRAAARRGVSLLIFDACEGLSSQAVQALSAIHVAAPQLTLVLTSQRVLGVDAEHLLRLGPLRNDEARALLLDRVAHARGGAGLDREEMNHVSALVGRLSNLPLAIELAASRLAVLDIKDLLSRLTEGLGVIDQSAALSRTVDWAISLLSPADRRGLTQATCFDGGFDLEAAEVVLELGPVRVIDWLQEMVRRSLVSVRRDSRGPRYDLYEAVEHRAAPLLDATERTRTDARFAAYFAHAAAQHSALGEASVHEMRRWMRHERRNLRAAEVRASDPLVVVEITLAREVGRFGGDDIEADRARLVRAIECAREVASEALLARTLVELGRFLRLRGRAQDARPHLEEAVESAERSGVDDLIALTRVERGRLLADLGAYERAKGDLESGLELAPTRSRLVADAQVSLGVIAYHAVDLDASELAFERARVHYERAEDGTGQAIAVCNRAAVARTRKQPERARRGFRASSLLHRAEGNLRGEGIALSNLGNVEREIGRYHEAREHLTEALRLLDLVDDHRSQSLARCFLGLLELAEGDLDTAERELERARVEAEDVLPSRDLALIIDGLADTAEARGETDRVLALRAEVEVLLANPTQLQVAADGGWFSTEGTEVCLARRRSAQLVLAALVAERERDPSKSLSREAMVEAGWPGERILEKAARQRLYVLVNTLRKLGLNALETTDEGYRLDPSVELHVEVREA